MSVWRVVAPPGYGALGDVVSLGLDPPTAPVQVPLQPPFSLQRQVILLLHARPRLPAPGQCRLRCQCPQAACCSATRARMHRGGCRAVHCLAGAQAAAVDIQRID